MAEPGSGHIEERVTKLSQDQHDQQEHGAEIEAQRVPVNVYEAEDAVVVVAPLPGVTGGDVEVALEGNALSIRAAMRTPAAKHYLLHEWHYGPFERTLELPAGYGAEATASFGNGQLAVRIKRGAPQGGRRVVHPGE